MASHALVVLLLCFYLDLMGLVTSTISPISPDCSSSTPAIVSGTSVLALRVKSMTQAEVTPEDNEPDSGPSFEGQTEEDPAFVSDVPDDPDGPKLLPAAVTYSEADEFDALPSSKEEGEEEETEQEEETEEEEEEEATLQRRRPRGRRGRRGRCGRRCHHRRRRMPVPTPTPEPAPTPRPAPTPLPTPRPAPVPCIKQPRGWYCLPCHLFKGPCKRDSTVLASMIFPPTQHCKDGGWCGRYFRSIRVRGRIYRRPWQQCVIYNSGTWLPDNSTSGYCLSDPLKQYSYATMRVRGSKHNYAAAFKWSMEQSGANLTCSDQSFCRGRGNASGVLGDCHCACGSGFSGARCEAGR